MQRNLGAAISPILGSFFGKDSGETYEAASAEYNKFLDRGVAAQNPFYNAGKNALPDLQNWLSGMKNPSDFINNLMGKYQESPWARYQQQQSIRAGTNAASAGGLTGSTPFAQQLQQNASNISSEDMQKWLQNVLGINTQYGAGVGGLVSGGQNAANSLSNLYGQAGKDLSEQAYNASAARQNDYYNTLGGIGSLASMFLGG